MKYIFVDEAGNLDFSNKGTKYFLFTFLIKKRPFEIENKINELKYDLIEWSINNNKKIDLEYFHATENNPHIRKKMFELITKLDKSKISIYTYILEKNKVFPEKREDKDTFYINNLEYATKNVLEGTSLENFVIFTDRLPIKHNKNILIKGFKKGISNYIKNHKNNYEDIKYAILHHSSSSNTYLQIVDYINWAIFRKYEREDLEYYNQIRKYIKLEKVLTENRTKRFY